MTEEQIIEIIKLEAHKNLIIVNEGTESFDDYVIRGVDLMAKSLVKLFITHDVKNSICCENCVNETWRNNVICQSCLGGRNFETK